MKNFYKVPLKKADTDAEIQNKIGEGLHAYLESLDVIPDSGECKLRIHTFARHLKVEVLI